MEDFFFLLEKRRVIINVLLLVYIFFLLTPKDFEYSLSSLVFASPVTTWMQPQLPMSEAVVLFR